MGLVLGSLRRRDRLQPRARIYSPSFFAAPVTRGGPHTTVASDCSQHARPRRSSCSLLALLPRSNNRWGKPGRPQDTLQPNTAEAKRYG
jgi:hypothetical protein